MKVLVNAELETLREGAKGRGDVTDASAQRTERLQVQTRIAREEYEKESDEVKAIVEKYVEDKKNGGGSETPGAIQK